MPEAFDRRTLLRWAAALGGAALPAAAAAAPATPVSAVAAESAVVDAGARRVLARVREPRFAPRSFPVTAFGAVADGTTDNTAAIRRAIAACQAAGGGHVVVPAGTFATGPIHLRSGVDLHLARGSRLRFATDPTAYLPPVYSRWQGIELMNFSPLIYADGQHDVGITGEGVLDGQADATHWWDWKRAGDAEFALLEAQANAGVPVARRVFAPGFHFRPPFIQPYRCRNVLIAGVTVQNSPFWHLHPVLCQGVTVRGVSVESAGPNTDGCDPESCDGVVIDDCAFATGDDCIALKAGRDSDGRRVDTPCQNVLIQRGRFARGIGGVAIGSEMTGGVRAVYARDLNLAGPDLASGCFIKTNEERGGVVANVHLARVSAGTIAGPMLLVDFAYGGVTSGTYLPTVSDIHLAGWTVGSCAPAWRMTGQPNDPIGTVALTGIAVARMAGANVARDVRALQLTDVTIAGRPVR